jgi:guanosine-3',5'-bis(diphosphate) 3'-pyrophosphohydrolase
MDWFSDSVFVFTPKGDVIELPMGSVPLDFAYRIHTDIGNMCIGAKVNGKIVPLDYPLKTGDIVEILTSKHSYGPSQDWLSLVKSSHARSKIRNWFKKQRREESVAKGREMVEALLKKHDFTVSDVLTSDRIEDVTKKFNFNEEEDLFAAVGYGGISTAQVVHRLTDGLKEEQQSVVLPEVKALPIRKHKLDQGVRVKGVDNLLIRLSRCCNPVPGDEIAGYVTHGRGVTVHRIDCPNLSTVPDERRIDVEWDSHATKHYYQVDIEVSGFDRQGLLNEVLQALTDSKTELAAISARGDRRGIASIHVRISIQNINHLKSVVERVKRVRDIYSVRRIIQ